MGRFLVISFLIHGALVLLLWDRRATPKAETRIQFEFLSTESKDLVQGRVKPSSLKSFFPQSLGVAGLSNDRESSDALSAKPQSGYDPLADSQTFIDGTTEMFGNTDLWEFHREIFRRVDSYLIFDSILAQYNHFGRVHVEFYIQPDGVIQSQSIRVLAENKILKVHSLRALRKSLSKPFEETKRNPLKKPQLIRARFEYVLGESSLNQAKQKSFAKSVFIFRRATSEKPIPKNLSDHLLSGGISYDPFAMHERWTKYKKRQYHAKTEFDPFSSYRKDPDYNI